MKFHPRKPFGPTFAALVFSPGPWLKVRQLRGRKAQAVAAQLRPQAAAAGTEPSAHLTEEFGAWPRMFCGKCGGFLCWIFAVFWGISCWISWNCWILLVVFVHFVRFFVVVTTFGLLIVHLSWHLGWRMLKTQGFRNFLDIWSDPMMFLQLGCQDHPIFQLGEHKKLAHRLSACSSWRAQAWQWPTNRQLARNSSKPERLRRARDSDSAPGYFYLSGCFDIAIYAKNTWSI